MIADKTKRVDRLERAADFKEYENGVWLIIERSSTSFSLHTSRLGRFDFSSREQLQDFIDKHHKGVHPDWIAKGLDGLMTVKHANSGGERPEEL